MSVRARLGIVILPLIAAVLGAQEIRFVARIATPDPIELSMTLDRDGFDVAGTNRAEGSLEVVATAPELEELRRRGLAPAVVRSNAEDPPADPAYYDLTECENFLRGYETAYPNIVRFVDLNSRLGAPLTVEGRRYYAIKISDNPGVTEDEPGVLLATCQHAREITTPVALKYGLDLLLAGYGTNPEYTSWIDNHEIWAILVANPDGVAYVFSTDALWRKNRRNNGGSFGVDPNRNFNYLWSSTSCGGSSSPSSETYRGPSAASEAETTVINLLCAQERIAKMLQLHSYGREVLTPSIATCVTLPAPVLNYYATRTAAMAAAASYMSRAPSAQSEMQMGAQKDFGVLGYLIEVDTSFQPAFSQALVEAARVWPAVQEFLRGPIPIKGHVVNSVTGRPEKVDVGVSGVTYTQGERRPNETSFGSWFYFIAPGNYTFSFSGPGVQTRTVPNVTITAGTTTTLDVTVDPSAGVTVIGPPRVGTNIPLALSAPGDAALGYLAAAAFATTPAIPIDWRVLPLAPDALLLLSLSLPSVFQNFAGTLDGSGNASAAVEAPNVPGLVGVTVHIAFLTLSGGAPSGIRSISAPRAMTFVN